MAEHEQKIKEIYASLPKDAAEVVKRVMKLEDQWLFKKQPRLVEDVVSLIKEVVK